MFIIEFAGALHVSWSENSPDQTDRNDAADKEKGGNVTWQAAKLETIDAITVTAVSLQAVVYSP
jgi:hypothetical protein